ncbi:Ribosomal lysine N-methyltransferase 5 [Yarrowia sp. C11]|nr:Ribosomal lysine N-methyltransferase 5 [Yarrowia sp. E02]KAG5369559.1 Ribosomal lysine N-methyltransferase 5 [Yarrowia sp. C11]
MQKEDLIRTEEISEENISDHVYELFSSETRRSANAQSLGFVNSGSDQVTFSHDASGTEIDLHQSTAILNSSAASTTGAVLWKVSPIFASWVLDCSTVTPKKLAKKGKKSSSFAYTASTTGLACTPKLFGPGNTSTVLELGCGATGLLACVFAPLVKTYVATDQTHLLKLTKKNIETNLSHYQSETIPTQSNKAKYRLECMELDWEDPEESWNEIKTGPFEDNYPDLVIACDTIYNEYLIDPFVETLKLVSGPETVIMVAQQLRLSDIFETFMTALIDAGLRVFAVPEHLIGEDFAQGYSLHLVDNNSNR